MTPFRSPSIEPAGCSADNVRQAFAARILPQAITSSHVMARKSGKMSGPAFRSLRSLRSPGLLTNAANETVTVQMWRSMLRIGPRLSLMQRTLY